MRVEVLSFLEPLIDVVVASVGRANVLRSMLNQPLDFSAQFTGWGCADKSVMAVQAEAARRGLNFMPRLTSCCEIDAAAAKTCLEELCHEDACLFNDVTQLAGLSGIKEQDVLKKTISKVMKCRPKPRRLACKKHGRTCRVNTGNFVIAGSSCTDFSSIGARKGTKGKISAA